MEINKRLLNRLGLNVVGLNVAGGAVGRTIRHFLHYITSDGKHYETADGDYYQCRESIYESVRVRLSSEHSIAFENGSVGVTVDGVRTDYAVGEDGFVAFNVLRNKECVVSFPVYEGYAAPDDVCFKTTGYTRDIERTYSDPLDAVSAWIVLEEKTEPYWTRGGNLDEIDDILGSDGSWVIDEVHKKRAKLSATNDLEFEDGTAWSGTYGNAFRHIVPSYYSVKVNGDGKSVLRCSRKKISEHRFPDMWKGKFKGNVHDGKLWSQPNTLMTDNQTVTQFFNYAKAQGQDYGMESYFERQYMVALHLLKFGTPSVDISEQAPDNMGRGLQWVSFSTIYSGATAGLGDGTGERPLPNAPEYRMNKLFGVEDYSGHKHEMVQNIYANGGTYYIYKGNQLSNSITEGHPDFLYKRWKLESYGGCIKTMQLGEYFDILPNSIGGTTSENWTDDIYTECWGIKLIIWGGRGLTSLDANDDWPDPHPSFSARLSFRGDISEYEVVTGAEMAALNN